MKRMKTEDELIAKATDIIRQYIEAMVRIDEYLPSVRVTDIRRRLTRSGYECYVDAVVIKLKEAGVITYKPETMDTLVYPTMRHGE